MRFGAKENARDQVHTQASQRRADTRQYQSLPSNRTCLLWSRCITAACRGDWSCCELFAVAGFSALLVLMARTSPAYECLALVAAAPLLAAIARTSVRDTACLFALFAVTLVGVGQLDSALLSPSAWLLRLVGAGAIAASFGVLFALANRHFGFNPLLLALLWVGFELTIIGTGIAPSVLGTPDPAGAISFELSQLFGFTIVSLLIILLNSFILLSIEKIGKAGVRVSHGRVNGRIWNLLFTSRPLADKFFLTPQRRGPPLHPSLRH